MKSDKIESIAITAIINEVNQFDHIYENLKKREKQAIWDGDLEFYQEETIKVKKFVGRIPVQVKGKTVESNENKELFYDVEIVDLQSYQKDRKGAIFFVVTIFPDRSTQISYKMFDLETIEEILKQCKKSQKTKRIRFQKLENNQLDSICIEFIEKLKVYKSIKRLPSIEVYEKKTLCYDHSTKYELEEMQKANEVFYETNAYKEAKEKLEKQNIIILHGEPWVGKTSTARKLVMNYIEQGYLFLYGNVDDLVEIKNKIATDAKIICLLDDFLGSNVQYLEKNVAESTLDKIIGICKQSQNKKLILTTRTYIYNNSKQLFYKFYRSTGVKDEYLIDISQYSYMEKGNILYNHLKKNNMLGTNQHIKMVQSRLYEDIIQHSNFNPGIVALICQRLKEKEITDLKEYIKQALEDPEQLWEEEYQKLNIWQKIILTIITLFDVKVPEEYVKEQFDEIIQKEKIELTDSDTFSKSMDVLALSFISVTFNEEQKREVKLTKHSIADFMIGKIQKKQIDINRYIKTANYIETIVYIDAIMGKETEEALAQKVEEDFYRIKSFWYDKKHFIYQILENKITPTREKLLKQYIIQAFEELNISLILSITVNEKDALYEFTMGKFKEWIIEENTEEYLYYLEDELDCDIYFATCANIFKYEKDSEYMLVNLQEIKETLLDIVMNGIKRELLDDLIDTFAEEIQEGREIGEVLDEIISDTVEMEIPSLRQVYSKKNYQKIIDYLCQNKGRKIEIEKIKEAIKVIYGTPIEEREDSIINMDFTQRKYIEEKFEEGIPKELIPIHLYEKPEIFLSDLPKEWWLNSFRNCYMLYYEFLQKREIEDNSLKGFAKEFLTYILQEKNKIAKETEKFLTKIVYQNFKKGNLQIKVKDIQKYEKTHPKEMKELCEAKMIVRTEENYEWMSEYLYFYIALEEVIRKKDDLIVIMSQWEEKELNKNIQEILELSCAMNTTQFNEQYLIPIIQEFVEKIEGQYQKLGKMKVSKAIMDLISLRIELDKKFNLLTIINKAYEFLWMIEWITGIKLEEAVGKFEYGINQKEWYQTCYHQERGTYELEFKKILQDKQLRKICDSLKVWDYLYDVYKISKQVLQKVQADTSLNAFHDKKKEIEEKYFEA